MNEVKILYDPGKEVMKITAFRYKDYHAPTLTLHADLLFIAYIIIQVLISYVWKKFPAGDI